MLKIKRIFILLVVLLMGTTSVLAAPAHQQEADTLYKLGLFRGTENGYALEETFTRAQGATMLVRLLGKEKEALSFNGKNKFADMKEHWAAPYVTYCVKNAITKGTSETTFSPEDTMTGAEFITLVMRSLGYENVSPDNAYIAAAEYGLASSGALRELEQKFVFLRDDMVYVAYQALKVKNADGKILARVLEEQGVLTKQQADELDIYSGGSFDDVLDGLLG